MAELQKQIGVLDQDSNKATLLQLFHPSLVGGFCREEFGPRYDFYGSLLGRRISHNSCILNDSRCERIYECQSQRAPDIRSVSQCF